MVGFSLALAGTRAGRIFLHSHQTAVLPAYRDRGIGRKLKLFQREDALRRGIQLVEWTFDPLELKNAYFNLVRLGAVARRLIPNCYGVTSSPLHAGLPTDRLVAEWWLDSARVKAVMENHPPSANAVARISLPSNIGALKQQDPEAALHVQANLRDQFLEAFAKGQIVTSLEPRAAYSDYVLEGFRNIAGLCLEESPDG